MLSGTIAIVSSAHQQDQDQWKIAKTSDCITVHKEFQALTSQTAIMVKPSVEERACFLKNVCEVSDPKSRSL